MSRGWSDSGQIASANRSWEIDSPRWASKAAMSDPDFDPPTCRAPPPSHTSTGPSTRNSTAGLYDPWHGPRRGRRDSVGTVQEPRQMDVGGSGDGATRHREGANNDHHHPPPAAGEPPSSIRGDRRPDRRGGDHDRLLGRSDDDRRPRHDDRHARRPRCVRPACRLGSHQRRRRALARQRDAPPTSTCLPSSPTGLVPTASAGSRPPARPRPPTSTCLPSSLSGLVPTASAGSRPPARPRPPTSTCLPSSLSGLVPTTPPGSRPPA